MIEVGASEFLQKSLMIIAFPKKSIYKYMEMETSKIILETRVVEPCSLASNSTGGSAAGREMTLQCAEEDFETCDAGHNEECSLDVRGGKPHMMWPPRWVVGCRVQHWFSRWWFHVFFCSRIFGEDFQFDSYFQMAWNHKLVLERETPNKKNRLALTFGENGCFLLLKFHLLGSETRNP